MRRSSWCFSERIGRDRPWFLIVKDGVAVGTVSIHELAEHMRFGEFYLLDAYRNQGIGSYVLGQFVQECDARGLPAKLEYLKWNPVGSLYKRFGF